MKNVSELIDFLAKDLQEEGKEGEELVQETTFRLTRFFDSLTTIQIMLLQNIVRANFNDHKEADEMYVQFKKNNPMVIFNKEGNSSVKRYIPSNMQAESCDEIFGKVITKMGEDLRPIDKAVIDAKLLTPLKVTKDLSNWNYTMNKSLFVKKNTNVSHASFRLIENQIMYLFGKYQTVSEARESTTRFMKRLLFNLVEMNDVTYTTIFLQHFMARLEAVYYDENLETPMNKVFNSLISEIR